MCTDFFAIDVYNGDPTDPNSPSDDGVAFGMLVLALLSVVMMIYCIFADKIVSLIGARWTFATCELCDLVAFTAAFYTRNKWVLLALMMFAGPAFGSAVAINHAIIGLFVPKERVGVYLGAVNIANELGGEFGLLVFQLGIGATSKKRWPTIGACGIASLAVVVSAYFLIVPREMEYDLDPELNPGDNQQHTG